MTGERARAAPARSRTLARRQPLSSSPSRWLALGLVVGCTAACGPGRGTIGALLLQDSEKRLVVREVPAGLAAERAGLRPGDEILLIDGRDARQMSAEAVRAALAGEVGQAVKLTLVRDGRVVRVQLDRTAPKPRLTTAPHLGGSSSPAPSVDAAP